MNSENTLLHTNQFAPHYDAYMAKTYWYGPEMLFGLMHEYIQSGQNLLDLGIGTGLSSVAFSRAGINIYGIDGSEEMLKICREKLFAIDLRVADLSHFKMPYQQALFDHAISMGVFHLVGNLGSVFSEVARCLVNDGVFAFTTLQYLPGIESGYEKTHIEGIFSQVKESGIRVFKHSNQYIHELLMAHQFKLIKQTEFLAYRDEEAGREYFFTVYLAQK